MKQIISSRPSLLRSEFTGDTTNSAAYNLLVFWCNFYCYSVDSCHCICCDTYSLLPALIFTMLCECFLGHKTYWLSRTQMFNSVCVSSLRNVAVASFMGVFSADSYIFFLVWCKLEQNKGKRKRKKTGCIRCLHICFAVHYCELCKDGVRNAELAMCSSMSVFLNNSGI